MISPLSVGGESQVKVMLASLTGLGLLTTVESCRPRQGRVVVMVGTPVNLPTRVMFPSTSRPRHCTTRESNCWSATSLTEQKCH